MLRLILLQIVFENRFSGKTYFYTTASRGTPSSCAGCCWRSGSRWRRASSAPSESQWDCRIGRSGANRPRMMSSRKSFCLDDGTPTRTSPGMNILPFPARRRWSSVISLFLSGVAMLVCALIIGKSSVSLRYHKSSTVLS